MEVDVFKKYNNVEFSTKKIFQINQFKNIYGCIKEYDIKLIFSDLELVNLELATLDDENFFDNKKIIEIMKLKNIYVHELRFSCVDDLYYYYKCDICSSKSKLFLKDFKSSNEKQDFFPFLPIISLIKNNELLVDDFENFFSTIVDRIYNFCRDVIDSNSSRKELIEMYRVNKKNYNLNPFIVNLLELINCERKNNCQIILAMMLMLNISRNLTNKVFLKRNNQNLLITILAKLKMIVDNLYFIDWDSIIDQEDQNNL